MITNSGIIVTCVGIIMDARYNLNTVFPYGNCIFVNANAAIDADKMVTTV